MAYFISFLLTAMNFNSMDIIRFSLIRLNFLVSLIIIIMCTFHYSNIFLFTLYSKPIPLYPFFFDLSSLIFYLQSPSYFSFLPQPLLSTSLLLRLRHFLLFILPFSNFSPFLSFFYESLSFQFIAIYLLSFQLFSFLNLQARLVQSDSMTSARIVKAQIEKTTLGEIAE